MDEEARMEMDGEKTAQATLLVEAAAAGKLETLQELLATPLADVNAEDEKGNTALHTACANGHAGVVRWLLDAGARLDVRNREGDSVLHAVAAAGDAALFDLIMAAGFESVDVQNEDGMAPAHVAVGAARMDVLRALVDRGANLNLLATIRQGEDFEDGCSILHVAAFVGNVDAVKFLVKEMGMDVGTRNSFGATALHSTAASGSTLVIKELLASGAQLEAKDEYDTRPLLRAAIVGSRPAVELLLDQGAEVNWINQMGYTPLRAAVSSGDLSTITLLIERGADPHTLSEDGLSVLHLAAETAPIDVVKYFLDSDMDVDSTGPEEETPLLLAACRNDAEVVELLLSRGASVNSKDAKGRTPLHGAAASGDVETIELLLNRGADVHTEYGILAFNFAVESESPEAMEVLLRHAMKANPEKIHDLDSSGRPPLHFAAEMGDVKTMKWLLEIGADVHSVDKDGCTALHAAVTSRSVDAVELLLREGADVSATDQEGTSVLHAALRLGNEDIAKILLRELSGKLTANEKYGWSAFLFAAEGGSVELLKFLVDIGEDVNIVAKDGMTALHAACMSGRRGAVEYLVGLGLDLDAVNEGEATPLHFAANSEGDNCVPFLLSTRAKDSVNKPDKDGMRPLHYTARAHHEENTKALLQAGADVHATNNDGDSPLKLAVFGALDGAALPTVSVLCSHGAEWTTKCQAELMGMKAKVEDSDADPTAEEIQELQWYTGLRVCVLHWEQQFLDGVKELTAVPVEVVERGEASVKAYIADATSSNVDDLVYRCKVCVVGPSEWGKSSLVRSIETMKPFLMDIRDRTIGIELVSTRLAGFNNSQAHGTEKPNATVEDSDQAADGSDSSTTVSQKRHEVIFWDFAGQDVYQVAHSLFFSRRTLYVLVVDVNAYSKQLDAVESMRSRAAEAAMDRFLSRHVFRWVRTIFAHQPDAEFLVLGTKADLLTDEEQESSRVWRDLQSRIYQWKMNYMREIEEEYGVVTTVSGQSGSRSAPVVEAKRGSRLDASLQTLTEKLAHLASDRWIVVSVTRRDSIDGVRQAIQQKIEASERGFPMWTKYSRVLQAISAMRRAANRRRSDGQHRLEHGMMLFRRLCQRLMDEVDGLEYDECVAITRTLHDLGDVIWYEHEEAGQLRDYVILDPMLVIDIVREVISHEHTKKSGVAFVDQAEPSRIDGRVSHSLVETLPLWKHMDMEMMFAFKMLLKQFQLAYPADDGVMQPDSDLIVPSYWKVQLEAVEAVSQTTESLPPTTPSVDDTTTTTPSLGSEPSSPTWRHCWEYEVSADLSDAIFEQLAVQSYTSFMKRTVRAGCIESSCAEFESKITLHAGQTKHDVIRVEVGSADADIAWLNVRYYLMKLEKVLDGYSGLAVPRYVVAGGKRHSLSPAAKAVRDSIMMGRDVNDLRLQMPWLPPDLDWFINHAWRDLGAFQELQLMHLVRDKLAVLQKLVVKGDAQRRYPALWSLEYKSAKRVAVLRILSDLSGRCYHVPMEIEVPPAFLASYGSNIKDGISLLSNIMSDSPSVPILQTAIDGAIACLGAKAEQAANIHNLIERLDLSTSTGSVIRNSTNAALSPRGATAMLRDLLQIYNDSLDEMSITEICNLERAATSKGDYVWAHPHEISMLKRELTPCQPRFEVGPNSVSDAVRKPISFSEPYSQTQPHEEPEASSSSGSGGSKLPLSLCIETVTGLVDWDWYKTYCTWELLYGDLETPLAAGATATSADSSSPPSWGALQMPLEGVASVEMLQQCRLVVHVKRRSRIGWTKLIGEGHVELCSLVSVDAEFALQCRPIQVELRASGSMKPVVLCKISATS